MNTVNKAYPIDGNDHGYEGDIVMLHKNGTYEIAFTNRIDGSEWKDHRGRISKGFEDSIKSGYTHWLPLNAFFDNPNSAWTG